MSLQWQLSRVVPADTAELGQQLFGAEYAYRMLGDRFDQLLPEEQVFAGLYCETGRGAIPPLLVALVSVFQFLEKVPDRQAAEMVISRIDWKYALHLPLTYAGFHFTDLYAFRVRLYEHQEERRLFEEVLEKLKGMGLIKTRGKMRTDSSHVLGVVQRLTQLELVRETLRVALRASREVAGEWVEHSLPPSFCEAYAVRRSEYGLSNEEVQAQLLQAGKDGYWFLEQVDHSAPEVVRGLAEIGVLRTVLQQQFPQGPAQPPAKRPNGHDVIETPHETEARHATKRGQSWIGYKVQVTETCDEDKPRLIVDLEPTGALDNDSPELPHIQARLQAQDTLPDEQQVDQGYMSGEHLVKSAKLGINLMGVPLDDTQGPAGFQQSDFRIDPEHQQATCPAGQTNQVWSEKESKEGDPPFTLIRFAAKTCQACAFFGQCTTSGQGRSLTLHPYRAALEARRAEAKTEAFRERLHLRAGIEGTLSELVRAHGLRHSRYRGQGKLRLQGYFTAVATNLKRTLRWLAAPPKPLIMSLSYC
jgi:transposase